MSLSGKRRKRILSGDAVAGEAFGMARPDTPLAVGAGVLKGNFLK